MAVIYFYDRLLVSSQEYSLIWDRKNIGIIIPAVYGAMHFFTAANLLLQICTPTDAPYEVIHIPLCIVSSTI